MKTFLAIVVCLSLLSTSICFAENALNEESIKTFLTVYPQYMKLVEESFKGVSEPGDFKYDYVKKLENLLQSHNLDMGEWAKIAEKVMKGYMAVNMQKAGAALPAQLESSTTTISSPEELAVIKKYFSQIKRVIEAASQNMR